MFKKKIIPVIIVCTLLLMSVVPLASALVYDISVLATNNFLVYDDASYVNNVFASSSYLELENGVYYLNKDTIDAYKNWKKYTAISLVNFDITFPTTDFTYGQSYNISFDVASGFYGNYCSIAFPTHQGVLLTFADHLLMSQKIQETGTGVLSWQATKDKFSVFSDSNLLIKPAKEYGLFTSTHVSYDVKIPMDYESGTMLPLVFLWRSVEPQYMQISNFKITPLGATQYLFDESKFRDDVREGLLNLEGEMNEGFSNISGEIEEGFSNLLEQPEQEKQEAGETGNDALDSVIGAIDDKGPGVINAFSSLVSALSYNGTEAKWQVPSIKLPAIDGLWDEIVLTENAEIDFNYWIDKIPPSIITLSQALTTIAFIIYCFKELYDIISYVLTLRRS